MSIAVNSLCYRSCRSDGPLRERLVFFAREKPRYGYRRLQVMLEREGERVNHKRLYRVYRESPLTLHHSRICRLAHNHSFGPTPPLRLDG